LLANLLACAAVQGGTSTGVSKVNVPVTVNYALPKYAYRQGETWKPLNPIGLAGMLYFSTDGKPIDFTIGAAHDHERGLEAFDTAQTQLQTQVSPDVRFVEARLTNAGSMVALARAAVVNGSIQLRLRPVIDEITFSTPATSAKPGETVRLEYIPWTPGVAPYRVLMDDQVRKTARVMAGQTAVKSVAVNNENVILELAANAMPGTQIEVRLELRNDEIASQTHPLETVSTSTSLTVGAP
jgi:hypothetical protein